MRDTMWLQHVAVCKLLQKNYDTSALHTSPKEPLQGQQNVVRPFDRVTSPDEWPGHPLLL